MKLPVQMNSPLFIDSLCLPIFVCGVKNNGIAGKRRSGYKFICFDSPNRNEIPVIQFRDAQYTGIRRRNRYPVALIA
jgi:hypothetical protein